MLEAGIAELGVRNQETDTRVTPSLTPRSPKMLVRLLVMEHARHLLYSAAQMIYTYIYRSIYLGQSIYVLEKWWTM